MKLKSSKNLNLPNAHDIKQIYSRIKGHPRKRQNMVRETPDLAMRVFHIFHDPVIGIEFVKMYQDSDDYHHSAYHISVELGKPIERRRVVDQFVSKVDEGFNFTVPAGFRQSCSQDCDIGIGVDALRIGVYKPKNPEDKYR